MAFWSRPVSVFPLLHSPFEAPKARAWWEAGSAAALVGVAVFAVQFSIDGYGLDAAAEAWSSAAAGLREMLGRAVETMVMFLEGPAMLWIMLMLGLPILLFSTAIPSEPERSKWTGWLGAVVGAGSLAGGVSLFLRQGVVADWLVFPSPPSERPCGVWHWRSPLECPPNAAPRPTSEGGHRFERVQQGRHGRGEREEAGLV